MGHGPKLHFLGWDKPVLHLAAERLLPTTPGNTCDLSNLLIIVPTRHSGRRLREHLALMASRKDAAVLPPSVLAPDTFLAIAGGSVPGADRSESLAVWVDVLNSCSEALAAPVIGHSETPRDFRWLLGVARRIYELRNVLGENGLGIAEVAETLGSLDEPERWAALSELERAYLAKLGSLGLRDPNELRKEAAANPVLNETVERVVLFAVPDPSPLAIAALDRVSQQVPVDVFVHAPEELADTFDCWGRPLRKAWVSRRLEIPDDNLHLVEKPRDQAGAVVRLMGSGPLAPEELAIGVPDREMIPFLTQSLDLEGAEAYSPGGEPTANHELVMLVEMLNELATDGSSEAFGALVRHPDMLKLIAGRHKHVHPSGVLTELDAFLADHIPPTFASLGEMLEAAVDPPEMVQAAWLTVSEQLTRLEGAGFADGLLGFLSEVYEARSLDRQDKADREFATAAQEVTRLATQLGGGVFDELGLTSSDRMALFKLGLQALVHYPERQAGSIDLEGWLELHWDDAPHLVVTGMNDGKVPEAVVGDPFLPDRARGKLGLKTNDDRFARDVYLLSAMLECRKDEGSLNLLVGRTSSSGDPLRPSRLMFLCPDDVLPQRTTKLFLDVADAGAAVPETATWRLRPRKVDTPRRLSVTRFRGYLQCPFRFYLGSVLGMDAVVPGKSEMDAGQFGTACHMALELFGRDPGSRDATDPDEIADSLIRRAEWWVRQHFGDNLPAALLIQLDAIRQRLRAAATVQAGLRAEGWRIVQAEQTLTIDIGGMTVSGKLDRIDKHEDDRYRVLDYKSSDTPVDPASAHLAPAAGDEPEFMCLERDGKPKRWKDLQLPLYRMMLEQQYGSAVECGYFNLPKAVSRTGVAVWKDLDAGLITSAKECAEGVVDAINNRVFWPPAQKVKWDDFEGLFFGEIEDCVDLEWLKKELKFGGME